MLIADDHALVRAGLRSLLEDMAGIEVVGEAADGRAALEAVAAQRPDVVLMDIKMPALNGLDATARIAAVHAGVRVLILSMSDNEPYVLQAMRAGAAGYLLKTITPDELERAIRAVVRGEIYLTPAVAKQVVAGYVRPGSVGGSLEGLTSRQREVLQLIAEGHTTKEIGALLGISVKTVESHRTQLMQALDIHDVAGLVRYAIRTGLIDPT